MVSGDCSTLMPDIVNKQGRIWIPP